MANSLNIEASRPTRTALALARFAAGLSQRELAARARVSVGTISNLEAGKYGPRMQTAQAIAQALGYDNPAVLFIDLEAGV